MNLQGIRSAYQAFRSSSNFEVAIVSATKAGFSGSGYSVELFGDSNYRILWDNNIGNRYDSPGLILGVERLNDDEWDDDGEHFFDNAIEAMDDKFEQAIKDAEQAMQTA